jgi:hypothetical protein
MLRRLPILCAPALCATLLCAGLALAAAPPPALEGADIEAAAAKAAAEAAGKNGPKEGLPSAQHVKEALKAVESRENEAGKSIEGMLNKASSQSGSNLPPPAPSAGSRKAIYGDIIIHR